MLFKIDKTGYIQTLSFFLFFSSSSNNTFISQIHSTMFIFFVPYTVVFLQRTFFFQCFQDNNSQSLSTCEWVYIVQINRWDSKSVDGNYYLENSIDKTRKCLIGWKSWKKSGIVWRFSQLLNYRKKALEKVFF